MHVESEVAVPQGCSKLLLTEFSTGMTPRSKRFYKTGVVNHLAYHTVTPFKTKYTVYTAIFEIFRNLIFRKFKNFRKVKGLKEDDGYKRK